MRADSLGAYQFAAQQNAGTVGDTNSFMALGWSDDNRMVCYSNLASKQVYSSTTYNSNVIGDWVSLCSVGREE